MDRGKEILERTGECRHSGADPRGHRLGAREFLWGQDDIEREGIWWDVRELKF